MGGGKRQKKQRRGQSLPREPFTPLGWLFYSVGLRAEYFFVLAGRGACFFARRVRGAVRLLLRMAGSGLRRFFSAVWDDLRAPWRQLRIGLGNLRTLVREEREFGGSPAGAGAAYLLHGVRSYRHLLWRSAAYLLPLAALAVLGVTVRTVFSYTFALRVEYRGETVGFIENEGVYDAAYADILDRVEGADTAEDWYTRPEYTLTIVDSAALYTSDELVNRIIRTSESEFCSATGIYINGDLIGVTDRSAQLTQELDALKAPMKQGHEDDPDWFVDFQQEVALKSGLYFTKTVIPLEKLLARLHGVEPVTLADGTVLENDDLLTVQVTQNVTRTIEVRLPDQEIEDDTLEWGVALVDQEAETGLEELHEQVVYVNGEEISRVEVSPRTVLVQAKAKITRKGVYNPFGGTAGDPATGEFTWPVPHYRRISRWAVYGHRGADIVADLGTTIVAADNGIVEVATTASGALWSYGKFVKIDHGNGFATLYAHCSELLVSEGEYVVKGQPIARVGSTGYSTGAHCHFEIQLDGKWTDTRAYVMPPQDAGDDA